MGYIKIYIYANLVEHQSRQIERSTAVSDKNLRLHGARLMNYDFDPLSNRAGTVSPPELQNDFENE